jgi:hypothetical protein
MNTVDTEKKLIFKKKDIENRSGHMNILNLLKKRLRIKNIVY